jgi:hypothetical protein
MHEYSPTRLLARGIAACFEQPSRHGLQSKIGAHVLRVYYLY